MRVMVNVCDVCNNPRVDAVRYEIKQNGTRTVLDLCETDAKPLRTLLAQFPTSKPIGRPAATSAASATKKAPARKATAAKKAPAAKKAASRVVTMADVEAAKKA